MIFSEIEYRDVSFSYQADDVLSHIKCHDPKGQDYSPGWAEKIHFCEPSARFYDTVGGEILLDGVNIRITVLMTPSVHSWQS